jgi:Peptidase family M23
LNLNRLSRFFICIPAFFFICTFAFAQSNPYPQDYFRWPVAAETAIVANMGELRPNHWHMGLDIRTDQKQNISVLAAAKGYIAKIKIEPFGFGRAVYINHPNGLTTLYAHLNNFFPELEAYVTAQQYKMESWAIEIDVPQKLFPVDAGQFIAYSGNTGGSQGPHLHFEIRDTKTDKVFNPLLFGFPLYDQSNPSITKLAMYDRSRSVYEQTPKFFPIKKTDSGYIVPKSPLIKTGLDKISFAVAAYDRMNGSSNEDGIYSAELFLDETPVTAFVMDNISYDETRYVMAMVDNRYGFNSGFGLQHLSKLPGDKGPVYKKNTGDGLIHLSDTNIHSIRIKVTDVYQNLAELNFRVQYIDSLKTETIYPVSQTIFTPNFVNVYENEKTGFEVYLDENVLYDTVRVNYNYSTVLPYGALSYLHQFNDPNVPLHKAMTVRIKPLQPVAEYLKNKVVMKQSYKSRYEAKKVMWQSSFAVAPFRDFGNFQLFIDTAAPYINELGRDDTVDLSKASVIIFRPADNFGEIKNFRAELDSSWVRFTNDKGKYFIYRFDESFEYGIHHLKVTAEDLVGNKTEKEWWFKKYPYTPPPPKKKISKKKSTGSKKIGAPKKASSKKKK